MTESKYSLRNDVQVHHHAFFPFPVLPCFMQQNSATCIYCNWTWVLHAAENHKYWIWGSGGCSTWETIQWELSRPRVEWWRWHRRWVQRVTGENDAHDMINNKNDGFDERGTSWLVSFIQHSWHPFSSLTRRVNDYCETDSRLCEQVVYF